MSSVDSGSYEYVEEESLFDENEPSFRADIIQLEHSLGYDCKRLFNLCLIDDDTLVFASGNFLHYYSISRHDVTFRPSQFGYGFGFITKNNHKDFQGLLTVAENGPNATVFIYEYPSHNVHIKLTGAAKAQFTCGSYNFTGDLFASQAGYPDFMLTIWRWQKAEIVLRSKAFQSNVLHVHFSRFNPILLASCGLSHIKFWKMADTFTGLKLQGDLGRFGKTDFSDIYSIFMLPDENVISGCQWGNMLLWEAGLIKFEITRKGRRPCHLKPISLITMANGEVTTVGMDGYVRIWFWETVDLADPPDDDRFVEIEPIHEFKVGDCEIRAMQKIKPFDDTDYTYYVQDGNGGIWFCDLNVNEVPKPPRKLYTCHGGKVIAAEPSPVSTHLMTLGEDGKISVYNYVTKQLVIQKQFHTTGVDLRWFSTSISNNGLEMVAGFADGVIRHLLFEPRDSQPSQLSLVCCIKSHVAAITRLTINPKNTILISGSEDQTIFFYSTTEKINGLVNIIPMGFVEFKAIPHSFNWKKTHRSTLIIGCRTGEVYEYELPTRVTEEQNFLSYRFKDGGRQKSMRFVSVKSRIRRDIRREEIKKRREAKRQRKLVEIEKLKKANPGLQIDMESALADSEPEEEEDPLHIPAKPNPVLWLRFTVLDTIWVSMGGYDAGYIYEMEFGASEPVRCTIIKDADDIEIHSHIIIHDFIIFGLANGKIRVNQMNPDNFTDLSDYRLFNMHDPLNGVIPRLKMSCDGKRLFSIGHDGNIFVYVWNGPEVSRGEVLSRLPAVRAPEGVEDIDDPEYPSLEQEKIYAEQKRQAEAAAAHDALVLEKIGDLQVRFNRIMHRNSELPDMVKIPHSDLLLDPRITNQIRSELQAELDDVREDLAYDLEVAQVGKQKLFDYFLRNLDHIPIKLKGVGPMQEVRTFRLKGLGDDYKQMKEDIEERLRMEAAARGPTRPTQAEVKEDDMPEPPVETFFFGRDPNAIIPRFSRKMLRLLRRYRSRQVYEIERMYKWGKLDKQKPDLSKNHPDDDRKIQEAIKNMGDYKLKIGDEYEPLKEENLTCKYIEVAKSLERLFENLDSFNQKVFKMREWKKELIASIAEKEERLNVVHKLLPEKNHQFLSELPKIEYDEEYPELHLKEHFEPGCGVNVSDILYLEKNVNELLQKSKKENDDDDEGDGGGEENKKKAPNFHCSDEMYKYYALEISEVPFMPDYKEMIAQLSDLPSPESPDYFMWRDGGGAPPWLIDVRFRFLFDHLVEQNEIIDSVNDGVRKLNDKIRELAFKRCQHKFDTEMLLMHMITLNQELNVMRDSEQIENQLLKNADSAMRTRNDMQKIVNASNRQVDEGRKQIDRLNEQISQIQLKFMSTIKGHKFYDFLRRIFKKKWRPPKPPKENEEDTSESSSSDESSSEEDTKSVDSMDMTTIRLDETICPMGLERNMYEFAFSQRSERHELEKSVLEQQKLIDKNRLEVDELQKRMRYHEEIYAKEHETLMVFRRKRQHELNKILSSVVLKMSQLQYMADENGDYRDVSRAILFDSKLLQVLRNRVGELKMEAIETKRIHRINIVHLRRMNTDIKFMRFEIGRLESEIKEEMMKKFGMIVNLDELEEEVLRKYVFELETNAEDEVRLIEQEVEQRQRELAALEEELLRETRINTNKVNVLTVLQEEKNYLREILDIQEKNYAKWLLTPPMTIDRDIEKLLMIDRQQKEQMTSLERDICTLRMKAKPLQMDYDCKEAAEVTTEILPNDNICPEALETEAYTLRMVPDDFIMERIKKIVHKHFAKALNPHMSKETMRKYAYKVSRYLGQAGYTFEGKLTDKIIDCIVEHLQTLLPKKHMIHLSLETVQKMFQEVLDVFDFEHSDVSTEEVISGIFTSALEAAQADDNVTNKTQFVFEKLFKELVEVLPLDEFQSDQTLKTIIGICAKEQTINPRTISIENLVKSVVHHARENLLDGITAVPIHQLAEAILKDLLTLRNRASLHCVPSRTNAKF